MAFEISEAGIAVARIGAKTELEFQPLRPGTLAVSPLKENVIDPDEFNMTVRSLAQTQAARKRKDVALILPDFCTRVAVIDFDSFPSDPKSRPCASVFPSTATTVAGKRAPCRSNSTSASHQLAERNAMRSRSRSTIRRVATLCTRPADVPGPIFFHMTGETSYP